MAVAPRNRGTPIGETVPHLFLSHSSKDKPWVSQLAVDLNLCGVDVWFDAWELRVGDDLHERIGEAVDKSRFVGVVVTEHFNESKWIRGEVNQALTREKAGERPVVLPLLAAAVTVPPTLSTKKYLDFAEDYFRSLTRLAVLIHELPLDAVEGDLALRAPKNVADCIQVMEDAGWVSRHVFGREALAEIEKAGGDRNGDIVHFDPWELLHNKRLPKNLRRMIERLVGRDGQHGE
jgi:hypothetical protein